MPTVPPDFGARIRAGRAYANVSRDNFAAMLDVAGASSSTIRDWERGTGAPSQLVAESLVPRLVDATGLPEEFYWGASPTPPIAIEDVLVALRQTLETIEDRLPRTGRDIGRRDASSRSGEDRPPRSQEDAPQESEG